jgi:hypothetical protein
MVKGSLAVVVILLCALVVEEYLSDFVQYQWEYKVVRIENDALSNTGVLAITPSKIPIDESSFNQLGEYGWELAACYVETETAYPNFGDSDYHTGIKSNVRSSRLVLIYKRSLKGKW